MYELLSKVNGPKDLDQFTYRELEKLATEIREFLINSVSKTGGHLASNLGVVELTIALLYSFDFDKDKMVWDVGHQSYVHKILTGRRDQMETIRQMNGLSGFPKRKESKYDFFDTGHSSTSVSAAVGMARARDLKKEDYNVVAVIGDGALTGGMAYEALNDVGKNNSKLIVILNDNEMSISENVGGMSTHLSKARTATRYLNTKAGIENFLGKMPVAGKGIKKFLRSIKEGIKKMILPSMIFEELGFTYLGPINGHDISELNLVLERAKKIKEPVVIHVLTKKGKGYKLAEENPNDYHGVSAFDKEQGVVKKQGSTSFSSVFGNKLCDLSVANDKIVAISAAMIDGTGLQVYQNKYPNRIFDVGIAEQHAVTMAAGMSVNGLTPVVAIYSTFLQRAYDQIVHDVATQNIHVVFAIDRAGIVGNDGETHQGLLDVGFLTEIPNLTVMAAADYYELEEMLDFAINKFNGPIALRYPRGSSSSNICSENIPIELGKSVAVKEGKDITIVAYGKMVENAIKAAELLKEKGIVAEVVNLRFLKPLDFDTIVSSVDKTKRLFVLEESTLDSGVFYKISSEVERQLGASVPINRVCFPDEFIEHGNTGDIYKKYGLDSEAVCDFIIQNYEFNK